MKKSQFRNQKIRHVYRNTEPSRGLLKKTAPTLMIAAILSLLMMPGAYAHTDGVDAIIKGVSATILPNLKFGVGVTAGGIGLCLIVFGLVKQAVRVGLSGLALGVIPVTLWDSIVGSAATTMIP